MDFGRIEAFCQKKFDKLIHLRSGGSLDAERLKAAFKKELLNHREQAEDGFVPDTYEFYMSREDYQRLSSRRMLDELYLFAEQSIIITDSFVEGELNLRFCEEDSIAKGKCLVRSVYEYTADSKDENEDCRTIVLDRSAIKGEAATATNKEFAALTVAEGLEKDCIVEFGRERVNIGRHDSNDVILADPNVSRHHAYVAFENYRHVIYDAGSTNGTFVNGEKVSSMLLQPNDEIQVGNSLLIYNIN